MAIKRKEFEKLLKISIIKVIFNFKIKVIRLYINTEKKKKFKRRDNGTETGDNQ